MGAEAVNGYSVTWANETDLPFIMALMRRNRESVGGLPAPAVEERLRRGTILLGSLNDDPCGYLMFDCVRQVARVPQACIQYDARRRRYGEVLVAKMMEALPPTVTDVRLRCAADTDANLFWRDLGFFCVGQTAGGSRRGRTLNLWQFWFDGHLLSPEMVSVPPVAEIRSDCFDEESGFLMDRPEGFVGGINLPKLAWANRHR